MMTKEQFPQSLKADLAVTYEEGRQSKANAEWRQLIEIEPSSSSAKIKVFYGDKARLRRWRGERQPQTFFEYKQTCTLDDWEYTETIKRQVLDDDQSGGKLKQKVGYFATAVDISLERETLEHLRRGTSYKCFDTNMFFGANHVYTDSNGITHGAAAPQSNHETGGSQLDATTIQETGSKFAHFESDREHVLDYTLTHVGVRKGTDNEKTARELANSQFTVEVSTVKGTMTDNIFKGAFGIIPMSYGIGDTEWYGFDLSKNEKPIVVLSHSVSPGFGNLEYTQLLEDSETGFWRNEFAFGVWGRFDWNPGDWRTAILYGITTWSDPADDDFERRRMLQPNA